jgi:hypothetical protein
MHGARRIGPKRKLLNDLFQEDQLETLIDELANSDMILKGDPKRSKFLNSVVSFHGPMYQVNTSIRCATDSHALLDLQIFDADELSIIVRWIFSLAPSTLNDMLALTVQRLKLGQNLQSDLSMQLPDGSHKSLRELFRGRPADLLAAFRASQWTIPAVSVIRPSFCFSFDEIPLRMANQSVQTMSIHAN